MMVISFVLLQTVARLVKQGKALVESNLSRNSLLETYRSDEPRSRSKPAPRFFLVGLAVSRIARFSHSWKNSSLVQFRAHRGPRGSHIGGHIVCFYNVIGGERK